MLFFGFISLFFGRNPYEFIKIIVFIICFEQLSPFFKLVIMIRAAVKAELL